MGETKAKPGRQKKNDVPQLNEIILAPDFGQAIEVSATMDGRCVAIKRNGLRCENHAQPGFNFCRIHAGMPVNAVANSDQDRYQVGASLSEKYQQSLQDTYLLHLRDEIAIIDSRVQELLKGSENRINADAWIDVRKCWRNYREAVRTNNPKRMDNILEELDTMIERGALDATVWNDIERLLEQRRKLVETEHRHLKNTGQYITNEAAIVLLAAAIEAIKGAVRKYVRNAEIQNAIIADAQATYGTLVGSEGN